MQKEEAPDSPGQNIYVPLQKVDWEVDAKSLRGPGGRTAEGTANITSDDNCITFPHWTGKPLKF
jgi:hypothetical protein